MSKDHNKQMGIDDTRELLSVFLNKIAVAKQLGDEWVETSAEVIKHFNPKGLGVNPLTNQPNRYFVYEGIKICEKGQIESIETENNQPMSERLQGKGEAQVETMASSGGMP